MASCPKSLVFTTSVQGGMWGDARMAARRLAWERLGPFVTVLRILKPPQQLGWPEPFPGQHFPHHPVDLRPRDPGHLSPPQACCRLSRKAPPSRHRATW